MSNSIRVRRIRSLDPMIVCAIRLMGRRDIARQDKDWEEADLLRDLINHILRSRGCEHELADVPGKSSVLVVSIPVWMTEGVDNTAYDRAAEFVGWRPGKEDRCPAWRCNHCGRVTNVQPLLTDVTGPGEVGPKPCPWCGETGTYERLPD